METKDNIEIFIIGKTPVQNVRGGNTNDGFPAPVRNNPCGLFRVAPVLMNRRRHDDVSAAPGDGNSGHLKREPYPFQMSDAIARVRGRVFNNALPMYYQHIANILLIGRKYHYLVTGC